MDNVTIEQARLAYAKAKNAFTYNPRTTPDMLVAFQVDGVLYRTYEGKVETSPCTPDQFALYSQSEMNRVAFTWLKLED